MPYIRKGPQVLEIYTQRTACNLLLYFDHKNDNQNEGEKLQVLRGGLDLFPYDLNFGELPNSDE